MTQINELEIPYAALMKKTEELLLNSYHQNCRKKYIKKYPSDEYDCSRSLSQQEKDELKENMAIFFEKKHELITIDDLEVFFAVAQKKQSYTIAKNMYRFAKKAFFEISKPLVKHTGTIH